MSLVGIGILVLGIFFTVKWAIDKQLIGNAGKVLIGILSGTLLLAVAHKIRRSYHAFSSILAGGGLAVLYFSIYIAFQDYHLLTQVPAFGCMVGVTICAVILSIRYDRKELAVIAIIGGFATPFFVSNNEGNYQVLFSYILLLDIGMFLLASYKKWNLIHVISYVATILIFGGWMASRFDATQGHAAGGLVFASLFYLVFFGMIIIYNLKHRDRFRGPEILMLLSNTFLYYAAGMYCLYHISAGAYQGIFTILLAVFNFAFAYLFYRRQQVDRNLIFLLTGLVLTFLSLTAPVQLNGNYITLFWAAEFVLLYWLGLRSGISLIRNTSVLVLLLALGSLMVDWSQEYSSGGTHLLRIMANKVFITGAAVFIALQLKLRLTVKDTEPVTGWVIPAARYPQVLRMISGWVLYFVLLLELHYQLDHRMPASALTLLMAWAYHYAFVGALFFYTIRRQARPEVIKVLTILSCFLLLLYPVANKAIQEFFLQTREQHGLYGWYYLVPLLALLNVFLLLRYYLRRYQPKEEWYRFAAWFCTAVLVFICSAEAINNWAACTYTPGFSLAAIQVRAAKIALPILWSICSFILMLCGMRYRVRIFRIISLALFALTILKLFMYDISGVGQGGRIAAFICLGILLLVVSFLYQKIKGLFLDQEAAADDENKPGL